MRTTIAHTLAGSKALVSGEPFGKGLTVTKNNSSFDILITHPGKGAKLRSWSNQISFPCDKTRAAAITKVVILEIGKPNFLRNLILFSGTTGKFRQVTFLFKKVALWVHYGLIRPISVFES